MKLPKLKFDMLNIGILNAIGENKVVFIDFNAERLLKIDAMQDVKSPPANGLLFAFNAENIYGFMLFIGVIKYNSPNCNLSYLYKVFFVLKIAFFKKIMLHHVNKQWGLH